MRPASLLLAVAVALATGGCTLRLGRGQTTAPPAAPVALVAEGSAFTRPGVRERVVRAVEHASGRRVLLVEPADGRSDPRRRLAARLAKEIPQLTGYDAREPQCAADADVLVALASNTDAVYRVTLDSTAHTRPPTTADLASPAARPRGVRRALAALHRDTPQAVREESVAGRVALASFAQGPNPPAMRIDRRARRLVPGAPPALLDAGAIADGALHQLPPPPAPEWEAYTRRLVAGGCPLLAMSVAEARLGSGRTFKSLQSVALDAIRRSVDRRASRMSARDVAMRDASKEASPQEPEAAQSAPSEEALSCSALCSMHMVELCNNDRALWIEHRARWEATPCGTRRNDAFLEECYRQQWQSGTFDDSCVTPCETAAEGRERLESMLRRAGCLRN